MYISRHRSTVKNSLLCALLVLLSTEIYAQNFTDLPPLKRPRFEASTVQYNDDLYVFNGFGLFIDIEPSVEKFSAATKTWSIVSTTSVATGNAVTHNGIVRTGDNVWLIGGRKGDHPGEVSSSVWKYNLSNSNWSAGPTLPVPGAAGGAALVNNRIHWFGGLDTRARCDVPNHFVYDLSKPADGWQDITSTAPMPIPRNHFATVVHDNLIYAIGGQFGHGGCPGTDTSDTSLVHVYNPEINQWSQRASMPTPQSHIEPSTFVHGNAIYVVGGETNGNSIFRYDPATDDWDVVLELPEIILAPVARVIDDKLIIASGGTPDAFSPSNKARETDIAPLLLPAASSAPLVETVNSGDSIITFEAEYFDTNNPGGNQRWVTTNLPDSSNDAAMITSSDIGILKRDERGSPGMSYFANFERSGTWYVWVRGYGDTNAQGEGRSDSLHAGINGNLSSTADKIDQFPPGWNWSNHTRDGQRASINVPATGLNAFNIWMREDGLAIDKIILASSPSYQPPDSLSVNDNSIAGTNTNTGTTANNNANDNTSVEATSTSQPAVEPPAVEPPVVEPPVTEPPATELPATEPPTTAAPVNNTSTTAAYQSVNGLVSVEIENFSSRTTASNRQWVAANRAGASAGASMVTTPDSGLIKLNANGSPVMNYDVYFNQTGTYTVWLRGWGDTVGSEGKSDSAHVGINGSLDSGKALQNFPAGWHWSNEKRDGGTTTIVVPSIGTHTINVWMREDGLTLDKLVMSRNSSFQPSGNGPAETISLVVATGETTSDVASTNNPPSDSNSSAPPTTTTTTTIASATSWRNHQTSNGSEVEERHEAGGVEFNGKLYVIGGRGTPAVSVFDPISNSWSQKARPPITLNHFQPVVFNNKIWVIGAFTGDFPNETSVPQIYTYTPATDRWETQGTIPAARRRGSTGAAVYNGLIYITGGNTNGHRAGAKPWFDSYNPNNGQWRVLPDSPSSRDHATVAISNNKLVVAAGRQSAFPNTWGNMLAVTDVYDFAANSWSKSAEIPTQRAGTMTVSVGDEVIVIGGESERVNPARDNVEAYNVNSNTWRSLSPLNTGRHGGAAAVLGDTIHVVSGSERRGGSPESRKHETLATQQRTE